MAIAVLLGSVVLVCVLVVPPKDTADKFKRIENLSKHARGQTAP